jgi:hypothetical protein
VSGHRAARGLAARARLLKQEREPFTIAARRGGDAYNRGAKAREMCIWARAEGQGGELVP